MKTPTQPRSGTNILTEIAKIEWRQMGKDDNPPPITPQDLLDVDSEMFEIKSDGAVNAVQSALKQLYHKDVSQVMWQFGSQIDRIAVGPDANIEDINRVSQQGFDELTALNDKYTKLSIDLIIAFGSLQSTDPDKIESSIKEVNKIWLIALEAENTLEHPLAPIVRAWLIEQIPKVEPARRKDTGILHHKLREAYPSPRLPLRVVETAPAEPEPLRLINNLPQGDLQLEMPGFNFPESELVPALPLVAYENAGGKPNQRGRGAPIEQRLFVNVLVEYEQKQRGRHGLSRLNTTYRDVKSWLYPNGTNNPKKVIIPRLRQGLWNLHNLWFMWERRDWNIIAVDSLPNMDIKPDDPLSFTIRFPIGMNTSNGALIGIEPLRLYGAQSAPKFRAWVRLAYLWDAAQIRNGGKRIYATIPKVLRNRDGYLVDAKAEVICTGDLRRTRGGWTFLQGDIPQTAWYHPLAIRTGKTERNPQADKMPILSDSDMVKLFYDHTERKGESFRKALLDARRHAVEMQDNGRVVAEQDQVDPKTGVKGWRVLEPHKSIQPVTENYSTGNGKLFNQ